MIINDNKNKSKYEFKLVLENEQKDNLNFVRYGKIIMRCYNIAKTKNREYGVESLKLFNGKSIFVRMVDKINRLETLLNSYDDIQSANLSIDDTVIDLINYSIYLKMFVEGELEK